MSERKTFFWASYADLMTSLFFVMLVLYFQYRSATLFPSLLWSVAEKGRGEEKTINAK